MSTKGMQETRELLNQINAAITDYDPVLKETARDLLIATAFPDRAVRGPDGSGEPRAGRSATRGDSMSAVGSEFGELLDQWTPRKASDRALLGAYYLARVGGESTLTSQSINAELKTHGLSVSNITRAVDTNLRARPPLMTQLQKMGTTRQARKRYRLTQAGIEAVERHLA